MGSRIEQWTNPSVRKIVTDADPVDWIVEKARTTTLRAIEEGWPGPPFDPVKLAGWLGLQVAPNDGVRDARTVPTETGDLRIEYNPNRSSGRIRYSVAHEISHTFFSDCGEQIRHRLSRSDQHGDDWQLEMLCNIGAAEIIMPMGTLVAELQEHPPIESLMALRRTFDVSTEALLLRHIRLTRSPVMMFAASRLETHGKDSHFRIEYVVGSDSWDCGTVASGTTHDSSLLANCTAIGQIVRGHDRWPGLGQVSIESVGVPSHPGHIYPRVLGLISGPDLGHREWPQITYLEGDATLPVGPAPHVIVHVMNDGSATWGGGFARALSNRYTQAQVEYRNWFGSKGDRDLGSVHIFGGEENLRIATMIAQKGIGRRAEAGIRYNALQKCLDELRNTLANSPATVHMPRIGCGIAGGHWDVIGEMVDKTLCRHGVPVNVYDWPA